MERIALIGYRGSGKSTVGPRLAVKLGWQFHDADLLIEASAGKSIAQIFSEDGEGTFRNLEEENLGALLKTEKVVLATGGGVILRDTNRVKLKQEAFVVWLDTDAATCWTRIQSDSATIARRPNLTETGGLMEIERLMSERRPLYEMTACSVVDGSASPDVVADTILQAWKKR